MDELKEEDASAITAMKASNTVIETKLVAVAVDDDEKTQVPGTANIEVQAPDQLEGRFLREEVVVEEVVSANGADIMVGAMDSDIYIDGVCICDFGDGSEGNLNGETDTSHDRRSLEVGLEIKAKALDVGSGVVDNSGLDGTRVSVVEDSNLGTDIEVEGSFGVEEPIDEEKLVEHGLSGREVSGGLGRSDVVGAKTSKEVEVVDVEPHNVAVESMAAAASSLAESSVSEEMPIVVEEVEAITREEILEGVLLTGAVKSFGFTATHVADSHQFGISKNKTLDQRAENGETTLGAFVAETQALEKFELTDRLLDQSKDTDGSGGDVLQEPEKQEVDLLHDEVKDPGIEIAGATSSTLAKELTSNVNVVEENVNSNEGLNPKAVAAITDPIDGTSGDDDLEKRPAADALGDDLARNDLQGLVISSKRDSISTKVDSIANATFKSMNEKMQATAEGEFQLMENKEVTCPNIEDSKCSHQPTQILDGEAMVTMINMLPNSREDRMFSIEECLDQCITCNSATIHSNVEPDIRIDTQIPDIQKAGLLEQKVTVAEHQVMIDTATDSTDNHSILSVNLSTSYQSMQSDGDIGPTNYRVLSDPDSEVDKTEPTCGGIEMDVHSALSNNDSLVNSRNEVLQPAAKVLQSGLEECLEKSAACDFAQAHSNVQQLKEVQDQVTPPKQFEEEEKKIEANSDPETASVTTGTNIEVIDGGGRAMESCERTLNSATELQRLDEGDQHLIVEEGLNENAAQQISGTELVVGQGMTVEEGVVDAEQFGSHEGQEMEVDEHNIDTEQPKTTEERSVKQSALKFGSTGNAIHARYRLLLEDEGEFSVSDLVWGKVKSHPWWPGQILDPSNASEKAIKYHKKDCFLVAYFGDRTFAWNEASLLKPFRSHFHQVEKQSASELFQNAVNCALEEVARRVELGLACLCLPKDIYDRIRFQVVENTGIQEESTRIDGLDKFTSCDVFEPEKLFEYMKELACCPTDGADHLELITAKSQLLAFCRFRGSTQLPEFMICGDVLERAEGLEFQDEVTDHESPACRNDGGILSDQETLQTQSSCHKRKHNWNDSFHARRKERSLTELEGEAWDSLDDEIGSDEKADVNLVSSPSGKKWKGSESFASDLATPEGRKTISLAQVSLPKPSFKIGDCIRRVASQMTGSPSILKSNSQKVDGSSDGLVGDRFDVPIQLSEVKTMIVPTVYSSIDEFLAQLHLAASDPLKPYSFLNIIVSFFTNFRNSLIVDQHDKLGVKRKKAHAFGGSPATFEFEDMNDTYWTDWVIQNGSEEQPSRKSRKRENQVVPGDPDKSLRQSNSRKRCSDGNSDLSAEKPAGYVDEKAPAELVMHFPVVDSVPSETNLNKMFRCFGRIKESETEVDRNTNRARVVFKRCSDAEAAYSSAPKFNIFGSILVNYQLNYTISVPFKTVPIAATNGVEDATLFLEY